MDIIYPSAFLLVQKYIMYNQPNVKPL